ncbi:uncharacterized protein ARMOST_11038 [Armillaria ostoyae]|uniref:Uncharacterized protein n=1 Tax=Armillaria ostoyae TaxID=47428 RepID=A0A284RG25_ARMOS|nr:uncharacterized protein ARMOST_11038 [Armillaria ostoyae]
MWARISPTAAGYFEVYSYSAPEPGRLPLFRCLHHLSEEHSFCTAVIFTNQSSCFEAADASRRYDTDPIVSLQYSIFNIQCSSRVFKSYSAVLYTSARRGTGDRDLAGRRLPLVPHVDVLSIRGTSRI